MAFRDFEFFGRPPICGETAAKPSTHWHQSDHPTPPAAAQHPATPAYRVAALAIALQASGTKLQLAGQMRFLGLLPRGRFSVKTATARYVPPVVRPRNSAGPGPSYPRGDPQSLVAVGVRGPTHLGGWVPRITLYCSGQGTDNTCDNIALVHVDPGFLKKHCDMCKNSTIVGTS